MKLGWFQRRRLVREGYLRVRRAVPASRVAAALRAINGSLGERGLPPERLREMRARTFCPELVAAPEILALYSETRAQAVAEAAIGRVSVPRQGQIALRFPQANPSTPVPHIDGMPTPDNGLPAGTLQHFTALLGVFLSDATLADMGNFVVWPGSHRAMEQHLRRHGAGSVIDEFPRLALGRPRPLRVRAGDLVLAHYALAHAAGPNLSPHVRYAVFFRLVHEQHDAAGVRALTDLWALWDGVRGATSPGSTP